MEKQDPLKLTPKEKLKQKVDELNYEDCEKAMLAVTIVTIVIGIAVLAVLFITFKEVMTWTQ